MADGYRWLKLSDLLKINLANISAVFVDPKRDFPGRKGLFLISKGSFREH